MKSSKINRLVIALTGVLVLSIGSAYAGTAYSDGRAYLRQGSPSGAGKVYVSTSSSTPAASAYKACNTVQTSETTTPSASAQVKGEKIKTTYHFWAVANAGYIFTGWYDSNGNLLGSGAAHVSGSVTSGQAGGSDTHAYLDYHASFIKQIQMSFITPTNGSYTIKHCGTEVTPAYSSFTTEGKVVLTALPADGYKLRGWYKTTNGGVTKTYIAFGTTYEPNFTSNVTIGADFVPDDGKANFWNKNSGKIYDNLNTANSEASSGQVIVAVNDGVLGEGTYTIKAGVTLLIPYGETYDLMTTPKVNHMASGTSSLFLFRKLTLAPGAVINCSGNICVGGQMASVNGGKASSYPMGGCGMLDLSRGGTINLKNGSILYAWGFVKGQDMEQGNNTEASGVGKIVAESGATVWEDFQVGEWRGGTASQTIYNNKGSWKFFPFQSYTIQNVEAPVEYQTGSKLKCYWAIFGNGQTFTVPFTAVGASADKPLFVLGTGGTMKKWYDPTTDRVCYELGGGASIDAISLSVMGQSVSSSDYYLPIPANMHIALRSGCTLNLTKAMTMHAGSVVEVKSGATLNINARVHMFDQEDWGTYCMYAYYYRTYRNLTSHYNRGEGTSKATLEDATLIVDGTVNVGNQMLYATAHGANICGNGGGTLKYGTLAGNQTMTQCTTLSDANSVNIRSANLHNDNDSYTKGIASTTFKNVNGRWFTNAKSTEKANHTYDFTYIKSGDVYGTAGTNGTVSSCWSKDKTGLVLQDKWANIKKDVCDNWWVGIDDSHLYNWSLNSAWHQYIKAGSSSSGEDEGAVITDIYAGSDGKMLYKTECDIVNAGAIDGNCLYPSDKALVNGSLITVAPNASPDHGYHKSDAATTYYLCFEGCVWHPATRNAENRYTVDGKVYIWFGDKWLGVEYDSGVSLYYSLSATNVKIYYEYVNHEWVLATPVAEVVTSAGTEQVYSLTTAITKAKAGGTNVTIRLLKNISGTISYDGTNNCGLDLNGFTLSDASNTPGSLITVNNASATFIIKDQSAEGTGKIQLTFSVNNSRRRAIYVQNGHVIVNNGTIKSVNTLAYNSTNTKTYASGITVAAGKKLTVNGGVIIGESQYNPYGIEIASGAGADVHINGGTITAHSTLDDSPYGIIASGGTLYVSGGTINAIADVNNSVATSSCGIFVNAAGHLEMTGGEVISNAYTSAYGVRVSRSLTYDTNEPRSETGVTSLGLANISGGTITAQTLHGAKAFGIYSLGTANVSGNTTINAYPYSGASRSTTAHGIYVSGGKTTVSGNVTINATASETAYGIVSGIEQPSVGGVVYNGKVEVNGGTINVTTTSGTKAYGVYVGRNKRAVTTTHASNSSYYAGNYVNAGIDTINGGEFIVKSATTDGYGIYVEAVYTESGASAYPSATATPKCAVFGGKFKVTSTNGSAVYATNNAATSANFSLSAGYYSTDNYLNTYKAAGKSVKDVDCEKEAAMCSAGYVKKIAGDEFKVTWKNHKGDVVGTSMVESGKVPVWTGGEVNCSDATATRVQDGWCEGRWNNTDDPSGLGKWLFPTALPAIGASDVTYFAHYKTNYADVIVGGVTTPYYNAQDAWTAVQTNTRATIRLKTNLGTESSISNMTQLVFNPTNANSIITMDLNGHSWTMGRHATAANNKNVFLHVNPSQAGCKLIIIDNSELHNGYLMNSWEKTDGELRCAQVDKGELVLQDGGLKVKNTATDKYSCAVVVGSATAHFTMSGGTVYATDGYSPRGVTSYGYADISGGTVEVLSTASEAYALLSYDTVTVSGGATIRATGTTGSSYGLYCNGATSLLTVDSCTINVTAGANGKGMYATGAGTIVVDGNPTIGVSATGSDAYGAYVDGSNSKVIINSGTFTLAAASSTMGARVVSSGTATINGGSFTLNGGTNWTFGAFAENGTVNMNGGNFTVSQTSGGNKEGIRVYPNGICNVTGGTYTLTGTSGNAMCMMGGTTSITGNPVFTAQYGLNVGASVVANGDLTATVTIDGGTFNTQSFTVQSLTTERHDAYYDGSITGDVTIWDGHFKSNLAGYNVLGNTSPTSCLKVRGGWFSNNSSGKIATGSGNYVVSPSTVTTLTSSDQPEYDNGYRYRVNTKYSVTWKDGASTIKTEQYNRNEIPSFDDYDPSTAADTYVLTGWTPTPGPIQNDQIYTAVKTKYEAEVIEGDTTVGYKFENFMDAWNAAKNLPVAKVKLLSNVSMSTQLVLTPDSAAGSKPLTLDLNNHTLAYTGTTDRFLVVNKAGCVLKIMDSSVANGGVLKYEGSYNGGIYTVVSYSGDIVLESGKIFAKNTYAGKPSRAVTPTGTTTFTMTGGIAEAHAATDARAIAQDGTPSINVSGGRIIAKSYTISGDTVWGATSYGICMAHGSLSISGNPILTSDASTSAFGVYVYNSDASFDIDGGTFISKAHNGANSFCIYTNTNSVGNTIHSGTFKAIGLNGTQIHAVHTLNSSVVDIKGGTFTSHANAAQSHCLFVHNGGTLNVSGGSFTAESDAPSNGNIEAVRIYTGGVVNISGGTFTSTGASNNIALRNLGGTATISGGTFTSGNYTIGVAEAGNIGSVGDVRVTINGGTFISNNNRNIYASSNDGTTSVAVTVNGGYFHSAGTNVVEKAGTATIVLNGGKYNETSGSNHKTNITSYKGSTTTVSDISETVAGKTYVYELLTKFNISWRGGSSYSKDEQIYSGIVPTNNECTSFIRNDSTFYFTGWSPTPTPVAGDATYQAVGDYYEAEVKIGSGAWTRYTDFLEAWDVVQENANCSIRLLSSLTLPDKILYKPTEANARTVFDLNNCTLTAGGTANSFLEFNKEDAILTITDDSSEKGGKISISRTLASSSYALYVYNGELVMKGGHIYSKNNQDDGSWHPAIAIYVGSRAGAKLTMTDGTVEAEGKYCIYPVYTYGTTDISGGTVKATASGITSTGVGSATGVYVVNGTTRIRGTANIEVSSTSSATGAQAGAWISPDTTTVQRGTLNIEGGTFDVQSSVRAAYAIQTSATIKEYGGKYCKSHGTANVSGGTFSVKCSAATADQVMALQCYDARVFDEATPHHMLAQESSVVNISGGTFTVDTRNNGTFVANAGNIDMLRSWGTLNVTGGTFTIYQHTAPVGIGTYRGKTTVSGSPVFNVIAYENAKGILAAPWNHSTYCDADATKNLAEIEVNGGTFNVKATNSTVIGAQAAGSISAAGGTGVAGYAMSGKITINDGTFVCTAPSTIRCLLQYAPVSGDYGTATRTLIVKGGKYRAQIASVDANGTISGVINTTDGNNIDNGGSSNKIVDLAGGYFLNPRELNHNVADSCMVTEITSAAIDPEYNNGYRYRIDTDIKAIVTAGGVVRKYHDIKKALDYAKTVAAPTITIVQDGTFVGRWDLSNAIDGWQGVLDLNGHTVTGTGSVYHYAIIDVTKAGTKLTIRDSSVGQTGQLRHVETEDSHWGINVNNGAELKLESGTLYVKNNKTVTGYTCGICINNNGGTFTQTGGKVEVHAPQKIYGVQVASASSGTASVSISSGEVEVASDNDPENLGDVVYALYVNRASTVTINGTASISATADSVSYGLWNNAASITTNIGGSASITASARKVAYAVTQGAAATGTVTINGNAVISAETTDASAYGINNAAGSTTISGSASIDAQASTNAYGISATGGSITVSGGTIETNGVSNGASIALYAANATASVSGGTFTSSSDNASASNVSPIRSGVGSTVTINGGTFNGVGFQAVSIRGGSTTINDGTFTSTTGIRAMDWADGTTVTGTLTVNGGTFNCTGPAIHVSSMNNGGRNAHSEIMVNGGKFKSTGSEIVKMTAAPAGATASTITIQGGYFNETDGTTFKTQIGNYVSNPYEVFTLEAGDPEIANGYSYEVCQKRVAKVESGGSRTYYTTIKAALDYAKTVADPTITLLANCTLTDANYTINPGNWTGTLDLNNFTLTPTIHATNGRAFTIGGTGTKFIVTDNSEDKGGKIYYKDNWSATNIIYFVVASGEMELAGGTLYVEDTNNSMAVIGFVVDGNPSQFTQSGGTFTVKSNGSAKGYYGKGTATFKGGAMNVESTAQAIGLYPHESTSVLNVSGSFALNVTSSTADSYGVLVKNSGATGTISGGKFKFNQNTIVAAQLDGSLTITGGYFNEYGSTTTYKTQINNRCVSPKHPIELTAAEQAALGEGGTDYKYKVVDAYTLSWSTDGDALTGSYTNGMTAVGATITAPNTPTKAGYTFAAWSPAFTGTMPSANTTYTATWTINSYAIRFLNYDGSVLQSSSVNYGETPVYSGETPTKPTDATYTYTFTGWSPAIASVSGAQDYTAQFSQTANVASVTVGGATTYYTTVQGAFDYAKDKTVPIITLLTDVTGLATQLKYSRTVNTTVTFDLNGHILAGTVNAFLYVTSNANTGTFIIKDSSVGQTGKISTQLNSTSAVYCVYVHQGTVTLQSGTIHLKNTGTPSSSSKYNACVNVRGSRRFNMTDGGGKVEVEAVKYGYALYTSGTSTISSGELKSTVSNSYSAGIYVVSGTTTVSGTAQITSEAPIRAYGARIYGTKPAINDAKTAVTLYNGVLNVDGGTFDVTATTSNAYGFVSYGNTFAVNYTTSTTCPGNYASAGTINVTDGIVNVTSNGATAYGLYVSAEASIKTATDAEGNATYDEATATPKAKVTGGKFKVSGTSSVYAVNTNASNTALDIQGGYYSTKRTDASATSVIEDKYTHLGKATSLYRVFDIVPALESKYNYKVARFYTYAYHHGTNGEGDEYTDYKAKGDPITLPGAIYTRTGYTQTGWSTSDGGSKACNLNFVSNNDHNFDLYPFWTINTNTVTYSAPSNGNYTIKVGSGTASSASKNADYGQTITLAATPSTGYHFTSWTITKTSDGTDVTGSVSLSSSTNKNATFTMPDYGVTVTAAFAIDTYAISYAAGTYGSGSLSGGTKTYGVAYALSSSSSAFTRTGYTYDGWSTNAAGSTKDYNLGGSYTTNAEQTFYPHWVATTYTITYDLDGGGVASPNPTSYTVESAAITLNNPTKTGYTFAGWTGTGLDAATTTVTIAAGSTGNRSYTATWTANTYSVRFNKNDEGATGTMSNEAFTYDVAKALTANAFTKTGYNFDGWATSAGGDVVYTDGQSVSNLSSTQGAVVDLYAKWSAATYTVTLNQNAATKNGTASVTMTYNSAVYTPSPITNPEKTGYTFGGWYTSKTSGSRIINTDGTLKNKADYVVGGLWIRTEATTLYARWTQTVTLHDNNGGSHNGSATAIYYSKANLTVTPPTREGYTVEGYYAEAGCTNKVMTDAGELVNYSGYVVSDRWVHSGATTLYAKWTEDTHTVTVAAGANGSASPASVTAGITTASGTITATPNTGYHFDNWTIPSGVTIASGSTTSASITINATADDLTITANFAVNSYDVTLNTNGGTINAGNVTSYTYGVGATLPTDVTKAGYTFAGWFDNSELTGSAVTTISTTATGDKEYWAKWTPVASLRFTGATDNQWSKSSNWDPACVPTKAHDVYILKPCSVDIEHAAAKSIVLDQSSSHTGKLTVGANKGLEVVGTISRTTTGEDNLSTRTEDLILETSTAGNATLIFDNSNSNAATVDLYSKGYIDGSGTKNYQYIGVPVTEANAASNFYGSWMYSWGIKKNGSWGWVSVKNGASVYPWTGYCITQQEPTYYAIEGTLVPTTTKDITVPADENMVVGNSWTAPIDINALTTDDLEGLLANIYFFNTGVDKTGSGSEAEARYAGGTYVTVPIHAAPYKDGDDHINSMQGFFVKNTDKSNEGTLHLNYERHVRSTTRGSIIGDALHAPKHAQAEEPVVLKIKVSGENYDDKLLLLEREDFSTGFDNGWDGDKWDGNESSLYLYTKDSEGTENSVSAIPELEGTVIGFRAGEDNSYTMYFDYLNSDEAIYLYDIEANTYTRIETGGIYWFMTNDNEKHDRFIITRKSPQIATGGGNVQSDDVQSTKARKLILDQKIYILVNGMLYDATGKMVK